MPAVARHPPDRRRRVDQTAVGRHVGDGDQLDPLVDRSLSASTETWPCSSSGTTSTGRRPPATWRKAMTLLAYSARAVRMRSPGAKRHRVEGHVPRPRRVLDERDLVAAAAEQRGRRVVDPLDGRALRGPPPRSRRSAPPARGARSTASSTGRGISAAPALLKWSHVVAARRVAPCPRDVDRHGDGSVPPGAAPGGTFAPIPPSPEPRWPRQHRRSRRTPLGA